MLPENDGLLTDFTTDTLPSRTFELDPVAKIFKLGGYIDEAAAMEQAIYFILITERYRYPIFSWNYGIELEDLRGQAISWVIPTLESRIKEALIADSRITSVTDFTFTQAKGTLSVTFTANTIFGDIAINKELNYYV